VVRENVELKLRVVCATVACVRRGNACTLHNSRTRSVPPDGAGAPARTFRLHRAKLDWIQHRAPLCGQQEPTSTAVRVV
jgi:hypothetical protein